MSSLILHHYPGSPYSQKVLLALSFMNVPYKSLPVAPVPGGRPVTNALVGGYRRIPILQIGAEMYCDSSLIMSKLDELFPEHALCRKEQKSTIYAYKWWCDKVISPHVVNFVAWHNIPDFLKQDREQVFGVTFDEDRLARIRPNSASQLAANFAILEESLSDGRKFILGDSPSQADIHFYIPIWSIHRNVPPENPFRNVILGKTPHVIAWYQRMVERAGPEIQAKLEIEEITPEEAFAVATRASESLAPVTTSTQDGTIAIGQTVTVDPDDTFKGAAKGAVVEVDENRITLRRSGEWQGQKVTTNIHFPRAGYVVTPEK